MCCSHLLGKDTGFAQCYILILLIHFSTYIIYIVIIGQLPRVSTEDRVGSVFEPFDCLSVLCLLVSKFSHFFLFHPPLFIQYSTEECSTVQLLARDDSRSRDHREKGGLSV